MKYLPPTPAARGCSPQEDAQWISQDLLVRSVTEATAEVFAMMLDLAVCFAGFVHDSRTSDSGVISLVGVTGKWVGSGVFCFPHACLCHLRPHAGRPVGRDQAIRR